MYPTDFTVEVLNFDISDLNVSIEYLIILVKSKSGGCAKIQMRFHSLL